MKIYTRTGDQGETDLFGGGRVAKDAAPLECCGMLDELNAVLGLVRADPLPEAIDQLLDRLQHELFVVGAELAASDPARRRLPRIEPRHVAALEEAIDAYAERLEPPGGFILPGGTRQSAGLHLARAVCRRAERRLVTLARSGPLPVSPSLLAYFNRLSDLLFTLARAMNAHAGKGDVAWRGERE
jgi:cob(I)alamin adenosyltransferase